MSSEFVQSQTVDHWLWFLEMQSKNIYQYMYILSYCMFTNNDSL